MKITTEDTENTEGENDLQCGAELDKIKEGAK
jgi:hypothetical protein